MADEENGERRSKRLRLEAAVERVEADRLVHEATGIIWVGVTKAALNKEARIGKNYIDLLNPADDLAKRIRLLLRRAERSQAKRDVEETRLQRNRQLEQLIALQARENEELTSQLNRMRSDLQRATSRLGVYERYYETESDPGPDLTVVDNGISAR